MKTISTEHPLRIKCDSCVATVYRVYIQLGHVRVEGWLSGPNRASAFAADSEIAERIGVRSLNSNAYGTNETDAVSLPFSFDIQNGFHPVYSRREDMAETLERTLKALRSARHWFSR
jgi:hypothetical protein